MDKRNPFLTAQWVSFIRVWLYIHDDLLLILLWKNTVESLDDIFEFLSKQSGFLTVMGHKWYELVVITSAERDEL